MSTSSVLQPGACQETLLRARDAGSHEEALTMRAGGGMGAAGVFENLN